MEDLIKTIHDIYPEYVKKCGKILYIKNGILLNEGLFLCGCIKYFQLELMLESGTGGGRSTEIMASFFPDLKIITVDNCKIYGAQRFDNTKQRLKEHKNIVFIKGNSFQVFNKLLKEYSKKRTGVFIDGPKGEAGERLGQEKLQKKQVLFYSLHDCLIDVYYKKVKNAFLYSDVEQLKKYYGMDKIKLVHENPGICCVKKAD